MSHFTGPTTRRRPGSRPASVTVPADRSPRAQALAALQRPWLQIVLMGTLLFVVLTRVTIETQNRASSCSGRS